jgi:hypothetical protein
MLASPLRKNSYSSVEGGYMRGNRDIEILEPEDETIRADLVAEPMEESSPITEQQPNQFPNLTSVYAIMSTRSARISTLAVVNENGYLVPMFTVGDLLFNLKKIWRATS